MDVNIGENALPMKIEAGTQLGDYLILEPIGSGGMGSVYLARHIHMGKKYAVKVLPESLASVPDRSQGVGPLLWGDTGTYWVMMASAICKKTSD